MTDGILAGRVALITGASRGIGAAAARGLAAEGAHVVLTARTRGALEEVDDGIRAAHGSGATLIELDLADFERVDGIGAAIMERFGRLDVLVASAGALGELAPVQDIDETRWMEAFDVNLHANWRLIRALAPLLGASDAGRAIFVSAAAARSRRPYWGAYAASKSALETMVACWAEETRRTPLRVNIVEPGATRTRLRAQAYPGEDPAALKPPESIAGVFVELAAPACQRHGEIVRPGS